MRGLALALIVCPLAGCIGTGGTPPRSSGYEERSDLDGEEPTLAKMLGTQNGDANAIAKLTLDATETDVACMGREIHIFAKATDTRGTEILMSDLNDKIDWTTSSKRRLPPNGAILLELTANDVEILDRELTVTATVRGKPNLTATVTLPTAPSCTGKLEVAVEAGGNGEEGRPAFGNNTGGNGTDGDDGTIAGKGTVEAAFIKTAKHPRLLLVIADVGDGPHAMIAQDRATVRAAGGDGGRGGMGGHGGDGIKATGNCLKIGDGGNGGNGGNGGDGGEVTVLAASADVLAALEVTAAGGHGGQGGVAGPGGKTCDGDEIGHKGKRGKPGRDGDEGTVTTKVVKPAKLTRIAAYLAAHPSVTLAN